MRELEQQEQFELDVLDRLNSGRMLGNLVFSGGTMLRLCFGLNRFSLDLDFWMTKKVDDIVLFKNLKEYLADHYTIRDYANKFNTMLFELRSAAYPSKLKIEIRKEEKKIQTEMSIAFSRFSDRQVLMRVASLKEMMKAKIDAFLDRKEIRDAFDLEFLLKKGVSLEASQEQLEKALDCIRALTRNDYSVKLGSLLPADQRKYYISANFRLLCAAINEKIALKQHK